MDPFTVITIAKSALCISQGIYNAVDSWLRANKNVPKVIEELGTTASTIEGTLIHVTAVKGNPDELGVCLQDLECELSSADALLNKYCAKSKKWHFNPKGILDQLNDCSSRLRALYSLLGRALNVTAPTEFCAANFLKDDALAFWSTKLGENVFQVDFDVFVGAMRTLPGFGDKQLRILRSKSPPKRVSVYLFAGVVERFGLVPGLVNVLAYDNPFGTECQRAQQPASAPSAPQ